MWPILASFLFQLLISSTSFFKQPSGYYEGMFRYGRESFSYRCLSLTLPAGYRKRTEIANTPLMNEKGCKWLS